MLAGPGIGDDSDSKEYGYQGNGLVYGGRRIQKEGGRGTGLGNKFGGGKRSIGDAEHPDAPDVWRHASKQQGANRGLAGTIDQLTHRRKQLMNESIPNSAFKDGQYPHTYAFESNNIENPDPTSQSVESTLSPLHFASLVRMKHVLPRTAKYVQYPGTQTEGLGQIVMGTRKWKTSDARPVKATRFQPYSKTSVAAGQYKLAETNARANASMLDGGMDPQTWLNAQRLNPAAQKQGFTDDQRMKQHIYNLGYKLIANKGHISMKDPDLVAAVGYFGSKQGLRAALQSMWPNSAVGDVYDVMFGTQTTQQTGSFPYFDKPKT